MRSLLLAVGLTFMFGGATLLALLPLLPLLDEQSPFRRWLIAGAVTSEAIPVACLGSAAVAQSRNRRRHQARDPRARRTPTGIWLSEYKHPAWTADGQHYVRLRQRGDHVTAKSLPHPIGSLLETKHWPLRRFARARREGFQTAAATAVTHPTGGFEEIGRLGCSCSCKLGKCRERGGELALNDWAGSRGLSSVCSRRCTKVRALFAQGDYHLSPRLFSRRLQAETHLTEQREGCAGRSSPTVHA